MKTRSFLVQVVVLLILGMLVAEAAIVRGEWTSSLGEAGLGWVEERLLGAPWVLTRGSMQNWSPLLSLDSRLKS